MKIPLTFSIENPSFCDTFWEFPVQGIGRYDYPVGRMDGRMGCQIFRTLRKVFELLLCRRKRRNYSTLKYICESYKLLCTEDLG